MPPALPPAPCGAGPGARSRRSLPRRAAELVLSWLDSRSVERRIRPGEPQRPDLGRTLPFLGLHVACLAVVWGGIL